MATKKEELETGCLSRVADDELVFVLRAKDVLAPVVIRIWAVLARAGGARLPKVREAEVLAGEMESWQREHGAKVPD